MNCCSAISASASVSVTMKSIDSISSAIRPSVVRAEKWLATRLRIDRDLPT